MGEHHVIRDVFLYFYAHGTLPSLYFCAHTFRCSCCTAIAQLFLTCAEQH